MHWWLRLWLWVLCVVVVLCGCGPVWVLCVVVGLCGCGPVWVLCLVVVVLLSDGKEGTTPAVARRRSYSSLTRTFHANCGRCFQLLSSTVTLFLVLQFVTNFSIIHKRNFCHSFCDNFLISCHFINCCCSLCEDYRCSRSRVHIFIK